MAVDLSDLLLPELVAVGLPATSRRTLFTQLGALAAPALGLDSRIVADALAQREKAGSTGFGGGVAIPHARLAGLERSVALVARLAQPLDFGAVDGVDVDVVVALLSPASSGAQHLKALSRVAHRLRDPALMAKLRGAGSRDAVYALLSADETRDAA